MQLLSFHNATLSSLLMFQALLLVLQLYNTNAWLPSSSSLFPVAKIQRRQSTRLQQAKSIPTFDLDALEAFEQELEKQEQKRQESLSNVEDANTSHNMNAEENILYYDISSEFHNKRIDAVLSTLLSSSSSSTTTAEEEEEDDDDDDDDDTNIMSSFTRSQCASFVTQGCVELVLNHPNSDNNNKNNNEEMTIPITRKSFKVEEGQQLRIDLSQIKQQEAPKEIIGEDIPLDILYEDEHMLVINKAAGMVVHPAAGNWNGTIVHAVAYYLQQKSPFGVPELYQKDVKPGTVIDANADNDNNPTMQLLQQQQRQASVLLLRPGIVHRLDKGTTGVLVIAKTAFALQQLSNQFAQRTTTQKTYLTIAIGNPGQKVKIDQPIARHPMNRQKMRVVPNPDTNNGKRALSFVDTIAFNGKLSLVQVQIFTGRTHQIRVHLQHRKTPIVGDDVYGNAAWNKKLQLQQQRPLLHAWKLQLQHPVHSHQKITFQAPVPNDMKDMIIKSIYPQVITERPDLLTEEGIVEILDTSH